MRVSGRELQCPRAWSPQQCLGRAQTCHPPPQPPLPCPAEQAEHGQSHPKPGCCRTSWSTSTCTDLCTCLVFSLCLHLPPGMGSGESPSAQSEKKKPLTMSGQQHEGPHSMVPHPNCQRFAVLQGSPGTADHCPGSTQAAMPLPWRAGPEPSEHSTLGKGTLPSNPNFGNTPGKGRGSGRSRDPANRSVPH